MYYYIIIIIPFLFYLYRNFDKSANTLVYKDLFYIYISIVFIISSCRYHVGSDYESYSLIFEFDRPIEPLYRGLQYAVKFIYDSYEFFVFIVFLISFYLKKFVFHSLSYTKGVLISYIAYFSFYYISYDINAMRQGLALGVTMLAGYYAYRKEFKNYIILVLLAPLIHYTAICFIPFYFFLRISYKAIYIWIIIIICFILSYINIFDYFIKLSDSILGGGIIATKINNYATSDEYANNVLLTFSTVRRFFIFFVMYFTLNRIPANSGIKHFIFVTSFITIVSYLLFCNVSYFAIRISVYYRIFECIWLSYLPFMFKRKSNQLIVSIILFFYFFAQVYSALKIEDNGLLPINTFFNKILENV